MKTLLTVLMVSAAVASPAFARAAIQTDRAAAGYADDYAANPDSVYSGGEYRGTDPDPEVRLDLRRESPHGGD